MNSAVYEGTVRHRRLAPVAHVFRYSLFMLYVDLAELPGLFDERWLWSASHPNLAWFRRADHAGDPQVPLDQSVRDQVEAATGRRPMGPIRLLTHFRYFGYAFNPVSFYYCFDGEDRRVDTIVAEVTNTPWGERHCYVLDGSLDEGRGRHHRYRFGKRFHVSPFMPMDVDYDWRFDTPGERLMVHMVNVRSGSRFFDATMVLARRELTAASLARTLVQYPFMTARVIGAIHWQALRLWMKRCPFYPHPKTRASLAQTGRFSG